jgi:APA family basic amino acid/polyamine antiporter
MKLDPPESLRRGLGFAVKLETPKGLRRGLGAPALFAIVQGFVAASIYFALGLVTERALGMTPLVFLGAGLFMVLLIASYMEGASLHQDRGGATVIARYAFNELVSFAAGWAILLDYLILIAICALAATGYAAELWEPLGDGAPQLLLAFLVIAVVAVSHVRGATPRGYERAALLVVADLALQLLIVLLGLALLFQPEVLTDPAALAGSPSLGDAMFAFTVTLVAFSGLDASSGLSGQVAVSRRGLKRLLAVRVLAALVPYVGLALVATSVLPARAGDPEVISAPVVAVVGGFEQAWLRETLQPLVALFAIAILLIACHAAMLGLSRLGYSLALNRQIPSGLGRLYPRRATPVVLIFLGALLAMALVVPTDVEFLAGILAFGATLAFTLVHLSVIALRWREPARDRPYRMPFNVRLLGAELPLPAVAGALMSALAFVAVIVLHEAARYIGIGWLGFGIALYVGYRTSEDKPLLKRITVSEQALTRPEVDAEYGSILVPVLGTPLDDDIMQTAGRLSAEEGEEFGEGGAVIEALWVFEIPLSLPIEARVPEAELRRARAALARAKAVGEEYEGVEVATATVRARRAGEAIVYEAKRRGVEAIVLAAEEPTRLRGGVLLGGKEGLRDTFVGETTRYVITKAPCRVILTAPPADRAPERLEPFTPPTAGDPTQPTGVGAAAGDSPDGAVVAAAGAAAGDSPDGAVVAAATAIEQRRETGGNGGPGEAATHRNERPGEPAGDR